MFRFSFTFLIPILVVVNVPSNAVVRVLDPGKANLTVTATAAPVLPTGGAVLSQHRQLTD